MKKIGIITMLYHNYNYGGVLQAFALQKAITKLGYDVEQINYDVAVKSSLSSKIDNLSFKEFVVKAVRHIYFKVKGMLTKFFT